MIKGLIEGKGEPARDDLIPLHQLMDPAPYTVLDKMPVARFYQLFVKAGAQAACIISQSGRFRGIISRRDLISATNRAYHPKGPPSPSNGQSNGQSNGSGDSGIIDV